MEIAAQPSIFNKPAKGWQAIAILLGVVVIIGLLMWLLLKNPNPKLVKRQSNAEDIEEAEEVEEENEIPSQPNALKVE